MFTACQQEEDFVNTQDDMGLVSFSLSIDQGIKNGTEYEPMETRAGDEKIKIGNTYNYIIVNKTEDNRYVVANIGEANLTPENGKYVLIDVIDSHEYKNFSVLLRPGNYEMIVFTGAYNARINSNIEVGTVLPPRGDSNKLCAITYSKSEQHENIDKDALSEEIFFGSESFTVEKTDSLRPSTNPKKELEVALNLKRRVSKFRLLLKETESPTADKPTFYSLTGETDAVISATMKKKDGTPFASGLDVWGDLWVDPDPTTQLKTFEYCMQLFRTPQQGKDGKFYLIGNKNYKVRVYYPYIFSMPGVETPISVENVKCSFISGVPSCIYNGTEEFTLKDNTITGFVLQMKGSYQGFNRLLEPVYSSPGKLLVPDNSLFSHNYEYGF